MDAIHAGVQEQLRERDANYERSLLEVNLRDQLEREAGSWAVQGALEQVIEGAFPNHPLASSQLYPRIKAAGIAAWRRTKNFDAVGKAGRAFQVPAFDCAKVFTADIERKLFSSQFNRGEAEKQVSALKAESAEKQATIDSQAAEIARMTAELAEMRAKEAADRPRILQLRSNLLGSERDLARHMTIEYAYRARLEQLDPYSALVRDSDARVRLANHGYEVYRTTGDWTQVKEVGRSFVDYQSGSGSSFGSDEAVSPTDLDAGPLDGDADGAPSAAHQLAEPLPHDAVNHYGRQDDRPTGAQTSEAP